MNRAPAIAVLSASLLTGASAQTAPAPQNSVVIVMSSYAYQPSPIRLTAGQPVRLVFQNRSGKGHDFSAPAFFRASRLLSGRVPNGEVDLPANGSATVDLVPARGTYKVHCGKFMHSALGMKTQIVVQ